jgi:hypothetical protein
VKVTSARRLGKVLLRQRVLGFYGGLSYYGDVLVKLYNPRSCNSCGDRINSGCCAVIVYRKKIYDSIYCCDCMNPFSEVGEFFNTVQPCTGLCRVVHMTRNV